MNFGLEKQLDRIVETLALSALMANNPNKKVEKRLREIAFPLEIELWTINKQYGNDIKNILRIENLQLRYFKNVHVASVVFALRGWLDDL